MTWLEFSEWFRNWAIVIGGTIGIGLAVWRALAADRSSRASGVQADIARRAHSNEVFNDAVGKLSHANLEVRLGAIYVIQDLARIDGDFARPVARVLQAYVRQRSRELGEESETPEDIREIMRFLKEALSDAEL